MPERNQLTLWKAGPVSVTPTGLVLTDNFGEDRWNAALHAVCLARDGMTFALGDLLAYASDRDWYDRAVEMESEVNIAPAALKEYRRVSLFYPLEVRQELFASARERNVGRTNQFHLRWRHFHIATRFGDLQAAVVALREVIGQCWATEEFYQHARAARQAARYAEQSWPERQFGLIYCDPPWSYEHVATNSRSIPLNQYPVMTHEEILAKKDEVDEHAAPDCVLYMWATNPKLQEALAVMKAWEFEYRTNMVWVKDVMGMGYWARQRHELLLVGTRGKPLPPPEHLRPDSVMHHPRREHSRKPAEVADLLALLFPNTPKGEMFARPPYHPQFIPCGNELPELPGEVTQSEIVEPRLLPDMI